MVRPVPTLLRRQIGGTRGDVQPALALAIQLAALGHRVQLAADARFAPFVAEHAAVAAAGATAGDAEGGASAAPEHASRGCAEPAAGGAFPNGRIGGG